MAKGLLESLAEREVPPVPADLNRQVHERLNRALLVSHLIDLTLGGLPYLAVHILRAVGHLLLVSFTGRFESSRGDGPREEP
jgi:hypothetical protein